MNDSGNAVFTARLNDMISFAEDKNTVKFTFFLDERQAALSKDILRRRGFSNYMLFGGVSGAKRTVLGVFPDYMTPAEEDFPFCAVEFKYRAADSLSHRDFLGALMSKMYKRECIGDILVGEGRAVVFVYDTIKDDLLGNIEKIGSVGVKTSLYDGTDFPVSENFSESDYVVASQRADCIVSAVTNLSREKASQLIKSDGIDVNYVKIFSPSFIIEESSVFSVKGSGKFILYEICGKTRKDRLHIRIKKYI